MIDNTLIISNAKKIALIGIMATTIEAGKLILASIPNVEVVTLLCALYGYCFGGMGIAAVFIFIGMEVLVWGVNSWVISYLIHWPLVCLVFILLKRARIDNRYICAIVAGLMSICFGVLTSLVEVGLFMGRWDNFAERFTIYYMRGIAFYLIQIVGNVVIFTITFTKFRQLLTKAKYTYFVN